MALSLDIVLLILLAVLLPVVFFMSRKQLNNLRDELRQQNFEHERLKRQFELLLSASEGMADRLRAVELNLTKKTATQSNTVSNDEVSVRQAIELARKGASIDELVDLCGLSRGEAELMSTIHSVVPR